MNALRFIIRRFDDWLSHIEGVEPFTDDPGVILRLQNGRADWDTPLPEGKISKGSSVLFLHLWNERIPSIPTQGPDLGWARHTERMAIHSFKAVARHVEETPALLRTHAIGGIIAQIQLEGSNGGRIMLERLGFTIFPYHRPAGAFGEFWENFYTWWLMWTYNPASMRHRQLWELQRAEFWMTREKFLGLYAR
jgi:hypothetical protein